jgi:hypothetical protein
MRGRNHLSPACRLVETGLVFQFVFCDEAVVRDPASDKRKCASKKYSKIDYYE